MELSPSIVNERVNERWWGPEMTGSGWDSRDTLVFLYILGGVLSRI